MLTVRQKGNFSKLTRYLTDLKGVKSRIRTVLEDYGNRGVLALSKATPVDTGLTSQSWYYEVEVGDAVSSLTFYNSNVNKGIPIAILIQYGHGTRTGGWVQGRDYINPALQPIFDELSDAIWKEVTKI